MSSKSRCHDINLNIDDIALKIDETLWHALLKFWICWESFMNDPHITFSPSPQTDLCDIPNSGLYGLRRLWRLSFFVRVRLQNFQISLSLFQKFMRNGQGRVHIDIVLVSQWPRWSVKKLVKSFDRAKFPAGLINPVFWEKHSFTEEQAPANSDTRT